MAGDIVLQTTGLSGGYGSIQVLFGIDLTVRRGETVALCGPNGVGKSTLVRMISGLSRPSAGTVFLNGLDVTGVPGARRPRLGMSTVIGQQAFGSLSVRDNLRMHTYPVNRTDEKPTTSVDGALAVFPRLRARADQPASTLSGGERQMLVLAKTLIQRPDVLLIDEFSLGLAPVVVGGLLELIRRLATAGVGTLLIEQSVNVAMSVADRLLFMEHGTIIAEHTPAELRESPDLARRLVLGGHAS
ncbi:branched-chain amino acid transport system ATP-binding protein [Actinoplanes campanulatus]|uniref:Branched-chain amino acid transport system ATP-binding protein n=1 Tax=Actinoplanes campanulatus TaxID=113559 RepID=A0A7W5AF75_9ACTN|nr:ABC transporter ATP-binding protein [Actinoplanes campanulatus]MBB3095222.1 branched-chain amino acid transport system ATP-binding protein [Actinoplanes campanulatus]GGN24254.1 ABC transporter ATP-binding protein [Actinoplanes campanulatus]GID34827.1 ABC transporter ATP-binding protein [Actinoplanes campanulatus]